MFNLYISDYQRLCVQGFYWICGYVFMYLIYIWHQMLLN